MTGRGGALAIVLWAGAALAGPGTPVVVGSKNFTEGYVLAEFMAQQLERDGHEVERRFGLGGTKVCFDALLAGEIDVYPEYTGTLRQFVGEAGQDLPDALRAAGLRMLPPLGPNNSYALAVREQTAAELDLVRISDLAAHPGLRAAFSHEFLNRPDGWPGLARTYALPFTPRGLEHGLAYRALAGNEIDVTDAYTTDGELQRYAVRLLADDREYFPAYLAVPLTRADVPDAVAESLASLAGRLDDSTMRRLNAGMVVQGRPAGDVVREFLATPGTATTPAGGDGLRRLARNTLRHLELTGLALALAVLGGTALSMLAYRSATARGAVLYTAGLMQTIPSIALLALMIPLLGIGVAPAVTALTLYALLPVVRNTITALNAVEPVYLEVAAAMGMTRGQQLRHVLLPLAAPHILAGIRTAAVIAIGTATLAAFIGAGGLGEPIVTGLALNDPGLILQGALPAAGLAVLTELALGALERRLIPAHLRVR